MVPGLEWVSEQQLSLHPPRRDLSQPTAQTPWESFVTAWESLWIGFGCLGKNLNPSRWENLCSPQSGHCACGKLEFPGQGSWFPAQQTPAVRDVLWRMQGSVHLRSQALPVGSGSSHTGTPLEIHLFQRRVHRISPLSCPPAAWLQCAPCSQKEQSPGTVKLMNKSSKSWLWEGFFPFMKSSENKHK